MSLSESQRDEIERLIVGYADDRDHPQATSGIGDVVDRIEQITAGDAKLVLDRLEADLRRLRQLEVLVRRLAGTTVRNPARTAKGLRYTQKGGFLYLSDNAAELLERYRPPD